jgi:hypothetical protein
MIHVMWGRDVGLPYCPVAFSMVVALSLIACGGSDATPDSRLSVWPDATVESARTGEDSATEDGLADGTVSDSPSDAGSEAGTCDSATPDAPIDGPENEAGSEAATYDGAAPDAPIDGPENEAGGGEAQPVPFLSISPAVLDFGTSGPSYAVGPKTFTITNMGTATADALEVVAGDAPSSPGAGNQFRFTTTCIGTLAPSATCLVAVIFQPTSTSLRRECKYLPFSAYLTIGDGQRTTVIGTVVGISVPESNSSLNCGDAGFEDTVVGRTSPEIFCTIPGPSTDPRACPELGAVTISASMNFDQSGDFAISTNNCTAPLEPGSSCTVGLVFKPTGKGTRRTTFVVDVGSPSREGYSVMTVFAATGLLPLEIRGRSGWSAIDYFGQVPLGQSAPYRSIIDIYVNEPVGNVSIAGTDLRLIGDTVSANFIQVPATGSPPDCTATTTSPPVANKTAPFCQLVVDFTPQSLGNKRTTIKAVGTSGASDKVDLEGSGTQSSTRPDSGLGG